MTETVVEVWPAQTVVEIEDASGGRAVEFGVQAVEIVSVGQLVLGGGGSGVTDHGALTGLGDDDHTQYLTNARGDARYDATGTASSGMSAHLAAPDPHPQYLLPAEAASTYAPLAHSHAITDVTGLTAALAGKSDTGHSHSDATTGASGFMSATDKTKINGIASGATANSADATLLARGNHTGTQAAATISDFSEAVDDRVAALLVAGSNITLTYNDAGNTLTIAAAGGGGSGLTHKQVMRRARYFQ